MSWHRQTIEVRELAQRASVRSPLAQFAVIPVLDAHQNQQAQDLLRGQPAATSLGFLQAPRPVLPIPGKGASVRLALRDGAEWTSLSFSRR
jgi:hypothetical protein